MVPCHGWSFKGQLYVLQLHVLNLDSGQLHVLNLDSGDRDTEVVGCPSVHCTGGASNVLGGKYVLYSAT